MVTRRGMAAPVDNGRNCFGLGSSFDVANAKFASNGYIYGTGPMMTMKRGERVRPYLVTLGERFGVCTLDIGTARWCYKAANAPMSSNSCRHTMVTVDRFPTIPYMDVSLPHDNRMKAGMDGFYQVKP
jgi:hypothetical protein